LNGDQVLQVTTRAVLDSQQVGTKGMASRFAFEGYIVGPPHKDCQCQEKWNPELEAQPHKSAFAGPSRKIESSDLSLP
jgi:hypothetical protein